MSKRLAKPGTIRCYPVSGDRLADALAGRLLAGPAASKPDRAAADWLYGAGYAAGRRWAGQLATPEDLERLAAEAGLAGLAASLWLRGFVHGALCGDGGAGGAAAAG